MAVILVLEGLRKEKSCELKHGPGLHSKVSYLGEGVGHMHVCVGHMHVCACA